MILSQVQGGLPGFLRLFLNVRIDLPTEPRKPTESTRRGNLTKEKEPDGEHAG